MPHFKSITGKKEKLIFQVHRSFATGSSFGQAASPITHNETGLLFHLSPKEVAVVQIPEVDLREHRLINKDTEIGLLVRQINSRLRALFSQGRRHNVIH